MNTQQTEIGAFEAKTHLSELLRETESGRSFVILRRGKPVARLVPVEEERGNDLAAGIESLKRIRSKIPGRFNIRELIEEGRKW